MPAFRRFSFAAFFILSSLAAACASRSAPGSAPLLGSAPFQAGFSRTLTTDLGPASTLPAAGGYSGTLQLGGLIQQYAQVTQTLQSGPPSGISAQTQTLVYYGLLFDARVPAYSSPMPSPTDPPPAPVALTIQVPAAVFLPGVAYYAALYDPQRPSLGWQQGFAGPATIAGTTLTFNSSYTFNRYEQYWIAIYAQTQGKPSPAPSVSPLLTPSPVPTTLPALQAQLTLSCSGTPCATGPIAPPTQGPANFRVQFGVKQPSLSGNATQLTLFAQTTQPSDVLYFTPPLVEAPLTTNAIWDFYYYIDQPVWAPPSPHPTATPGPTTMQALEFDFNMGMPNYTYNFSSQCFLADNDNGGPVWQIWGGGTDGWVPSGIPCNPANFAPNVWHHLTWVYRIHPETLETEYVSLTIDGTTTAIPAANARHPVQKRVQDKSFLEVQFQQDMHKAPDPSATPAPFNEWVDNVSLTYW